MIHKVKLSKELLEDAGVIWNLETDITSEAYIYYFYPPSMSKEEGYVVMTSFYILIDSILHYMIHEDIFKLDVTAEFVKP